MSASAESATHTDALSRHRWPVLHLAARATALAMRTVPRRHRFAAAIKVSAILRGIIRRTAVYREEGANSFDTIAEFTLYHLLRVMTEHGTEFDLEWVIEGLEPEAVRTPGKGVLIVGTHAMLATLLPRWLYDQGHMPTLVAMNPEIRILGTVVPAQAVTPSPSFLLGIRRTLRSGGIVCALVDQPPDATNPRRTREFMTDRGPVHVSDALFRIATRYGARIVFGCVRLNDGRVVGAFDGPSPRSAGDSERVARDFSAFIEKHAAVLPVLPVEDSPQSELDHQEPAWRTSRTSAGPRSR